VRPKIKPRFGDDDDYPPVVGVAEFVFPTTVAAVIGTPEIGNFAPDAVRA
jgi:hypothetical protein